MSHRFDQDKTGLRDLLRSGRCGELGYLVCRFTCDNRNHGDWGEFRYGIDDALMVEGSVHHLDILADLAGAKCDTIYAQTWKPAWGDFKGDCQGLVTMAFENGVRAIYEGAKANAVGLNGWANEYIRAECEKATVTVQNRRMEWFPYDPGKPREQRSEGSGEDVPLPEGGKWRNTLLIERFCRWLDGGPPMETRVEENLQSVALIFAAIKSSRTGLPVRVQELLADTREAVRRQMA
ncbi:MAG: Gfo/Idh/MocA family oxidoreductase, partial [Oscillospiraceae bacterium]|nr:Gfo/Idh/MocA family oxidoreductase [Oscillospiraceae bacterium]